MLRKLVILAVLSAAAGLAAALAARLWASAPTRGPAAPASSPATRPAGGQPAEPEPGQFAVSPPPLSPDIYPCSQCHNADLPPNKTPRKLRMAHTDIQLHHDEEHRWCLDCHDADHRDVLQRANGEPIKFQESYKLCGQCHGDKYRDWRAGVHGKRSGQWNGPKTYLLCVNCHNPHDPKFKPIAPMPPPVRPQDIRGAK